MNDNIYSFLLITAFIFIIVCSCVCIYFSIIACIYLIRRRDIPSISPNDYVDRNNEDNPLTSSE